MAAYKILYDKVYETLEASTQIKGVDDFNDQYNDMENFNLVTYPFCYVEAGEVDWYKNQNNFRSDFQKEPQTGLATIRVHMVYKTLAGFNKVEKDKFFDHGNHVVSLVQRLKTGQTNVGTFTTLLRTGEEYITPSDQLRVVVYEFETELTDIFEDTTETTTETITAVFDINYDVNNE